MWKHFLDFWINYRNVKRTIIVITGKGKNSYKWRHIPGRLILGRIKEKYHERMGEQCHLMKRSSFRICWFNSVKQWLKANTDVRHTQINIRSWNMQNTWFCLGFFFIFFTKPKYSVILFPLCYSLSACSEVNLFALEAVELLILLMVVLKYPHMANGIMLRTLHITCSRSCRMGVVLSNYCFAYIYIKKRLVMIGFKS